MADDATSLNDPLMRGLAAAALCPSLRSVLVFDLDSEALIPLADTWAAMLKTTTRRPVEVVRLGASDAEDRLWGRWLPHTRPIPGDRPSGAASARPGNLRWQRGLLGPPEPGDPLRIVLVPDLSRLDLPAARACVLLVGAAVAHLERHGRDLAWSPDTCWLAACPRGEVGRVSSHLLGRFALRFDAPADAARPGVEGLRHRIDADNRKSRRWRTFLSWLKEQFLGSLPVGVWRKLRHASPRATFSDDAARRVLEYHPIPAPSSTRSIIALARLAAGLARLEGRTESKPADVDDAASLCGLKAPVAPRTAAGESIKTPDMIPAEISPGADHEQSHKTLSPDLPLPDVKVVDDSDGTVILTFTDGPSPPITVPAPPGPPSVREGAPAEAAASLRLPAHRFRADAAVGPIIGVRRATDLADLAVVETLLEAVKWQPFRRRIGLVPSGGFSVSGLDLREYRRAPLPETMLVLLVDYTCLDRCRWKEALWPYIHRAYAGRGSVCLIQVGAAGGRDDDSRARRILARNLLVPRVIEALDDAPGKATPLAHGLDLALQTIRHAARRGPGPVVHTLFVLVTDGRGNVPLERDDRGEFPRPVGREGITSALRVASAFRELDGVEAVLLNPRPEHYAELPRQLARALGAAIESVDRPEEI
jgi:magnesium chelatase subunit D